MFTHLPVISGYGSPYTSVKLGSTNAALVYNPNGLVPTSAASSVKPNADYIVPGCPAEGWMMGLDNNKALNLNNNNAGRLGGRS